MVQTTTNLPELDRSKTRMIDVNGLKTRVYEDGTGEPLVMIHGGHFGNASGGALAGYALNFPELARHFRVVAWDKPGQGHTDEPRRDEDYTIDTVVDHTYGVLEALGIRQGHFLGHSRGGLPVTRVAIEHPEMVKRLIIVDSNTVSPDPDMAAAFNARYKENVDENVPIRERMRTTLTACSYSGEHVTEAYLDECDEHAHQPTMQAAAEKMKTLNKETFMPSLHRLRAETFKSLEEHGLSMPVLVIWGYQDGSAPMHQCMALFDLLCKKTPRAELSVLNRAGHLSFREQPEAFNRLVRSFCLD